MGYIRVPLFYKIKTGVLALGAQSKGAFCIARGNTAYLSDSFGDLGDVGNFRKFEKKIKALKRELKIKPDIIACDMHPEYISTKYAFEKVKSQNDQSFGLVPEVKMIQHHEAHVASCMADNGIKGKVIGVAFDGTGFGRDGNVWGGEFFTGGVKGFKRAAHLKYIPMPGSEACIREPRRMAFSYLYKIYGKNGLPRPDFVGTRNVILGQMIDKKINSPLTSSVGRLFDGVSSLIGVCDFAGYEGEAAIRLEKIISGQGSKVKGEYKFKYLKDGELTIIDWAPVIKGIVTDLKLGVKKPEISLKFHNAVCGMIKDVCIILRKKYRINKVCMSGGVFQNRYINSHIRPILEKEGFEVYAHERVPTHDGGIALGQAILATTSTAQEAFGHLRGFKRS